jgi:hypothetical protein
MCPVAGFQSPSRDRALLQSRGARTKVADDAAAAAAARVARAKARRARPSPAVSRERAQRLLGQLVWEVQFRELSEIGTYTARGSRPLAASQTWRCWNS